MADPYTLIPQLAAQYGEQAGQDSFYSTLGQMGQGLNTALTQIGAQEGSSPWLGLAGSLGGGLVQGYAQGGVQQAQQQGTNDAYVDMLNAVTASSKGLPSNSLAKYGQLAAPLVTATASQNMAFKRDLAKEDHKLRNELLKDEFITQRARDRLAQGLFGASGTGVGAGQQTTTSQEIPTPSDIAGGVRQEGLASTPQQKSTLEELAFRQSGGDPQLFNKRLESLQQEEVRQQERIDKANEELATIEKTANELETLAKQGEAYLQQAGYTGPYGGLSQSLSGLAGTVSEGQMDKFTAGQALESLKADVVRLARPKGVGSMSDPEMLVYIQSGPQLSKTPEANTEVLNRYKYAAAIEKAYAQHVRQSMMQGQTKTEADAEWSKVRAQNPYLIRDARSGQLRPNPSWQQLAGQFTGKSQQQTGRIETINGQQFRVVPD